MKINDAIKRCDGTRIFVTGLYGSGKSTFAKAYAEKYKLTYISFDHLFSYSAKDEVGAKEVLGFLANEFIIDAIPFSVKECECSWASFLEYAKVTPGVKIVVVVCSNREEWLKRVDLNFRNLRKCIGYADYADFYFNTMTWIKDMEVDYFDSFTNEYITLEQLHERISWIKPLLEFI